MAEVVTITESASQQVRSEMEVEGDNLRLRVAGGGCSGMSYELFSEPSDQVQDIDTIIAVSYTHLTLPTIYSV